MWVHPYRRMYFMEDGVLTDVARPHSDATPLSTDQIIITTSRAEPSSSSHLIKTGRVLVEIN